MSIPRGGAVVARWAHNPKVGGSNPSPAIEGRPNKPPFLFGLQTALFIEVLQKIGGKISNRGQNSSRTLFRSALPPFSSHPCPVRCNAHRSSSSACVRVEQPPIRDRLPYASTCSPLGGMHEIRLRAACV